MIDVDRPAERMIEYLEWDSAFFERRIARIDQPRLTCEELRIALRWCDEAEIDCLYWLVDLGHAPSLRLAQDYCFRMVDLRVGLVRQLEEQHGSSMVLPASIRLAHDADVPALRAIARTAHQQSRFYQDANFLRSKCDELYETWIEKSCRGYANAVFVAVIGERVAGYITCNLQGEDSASTGLLAVGRDFQGQGVGPKLVNAGLAWGRANGATRATVATQGSNVKALRLYERCGFAVDSLQVWYHRWFER